MQEIQFIAPAALHDEMLRLRNEKQMDFLESLTGMDWGVADEKDAPEKLRGLGVVYHLESTITGERIALKTATTNRELPEIPSVSDIWTTSNEQRIPTGPTASIKTKQNDFFVLPRKCLIPQGNGPGVNSGLNLKPGRSSLLAYRLDGYTRRQACVVSLKSISRCPERTGNPLLPLL